MNYKTILGIFLLLFITYCSQEQKKGDRMSDQSFPLGLELVFKNKELIGFIKNYSPQKQYFFHESKIQPTLLVIKKDNEMIKYTDERMFMKYDPTPYNYDVIELAAGEIKQIYRTWIRPGDDGYQIHWCSYKYDKLKKGKYTLSLEFISKVNTFYNEQKKPNTPIIWTSDTPLRSNEIEIDLETFGYFSK